MLILAITEAMLVKGLSAKDKYYNYPTIQHSFKVAVYQNYVDYTSSALLDVKVN